MKKLLLLSICILVATSAAFSQVLPSSARQMGTYVGILLPSAAVCSTERLIITLYVNADNTLDGEISDWDNNQLWIFDTEWPLFSRGVFKTTVVPNLESGVRGTFNPATGSVSGTVNLRPDGGCLYTFKAYRRYKLN